MNLTSQFQHCTNVVITTIIYCEVKLLSNFEATLAGFKFDVEVSTLESHCKVDVAISTLQQRCHNNVVTTLLFWRCGINIASVLCISCATLRLSTTFSQRVSWNYAGINLRGKVSWKIYNFKKFPQNLDFWTTLWRLVWEEFFCGVSYLELKLIYLGLIYLVVMWFRPAVLWIL